MSYESYFRYSVYAVVRADTREILYIGMTHGKLKTRLNAHICNARSKRGLDNQWLNWIRRNPEVTLDIEEIAHGVGVPLEASAHERKTIQEYLSKGHRLCNSTNGAKPASHRANDPSHVYNYAKELRKTEYYGLFAA